MTYHQLTQEERYLITAQLMCGQSPAQIARLLGRHRSTVTRELCRNATHHDGKYRAEKAHSYATARRRRCRRRARFSAADMAQVARLLRRKWSAEQVSGVLKKRGTLRISHETIYRRIRWDKRAGGDLWRHTRIMSKFGRKRYRSHDSRGVLPGKRPIGERPADKATSGPTQPSRESATPPASSNGTTIARSLDHATNSAASSSAALSLVAGLQYPSGKYFPLAGTTFYVLKESPDAALTRGGVQPPPGASPLRAWIQACETQQEATCSKGGRAVEASTVATLRTDLQGRAELATLKAGTYYVYGGNQRYQQRNVLWNVRVDVREGANNSVKLDQANVTSAN